LAHLIDGIVSKIKVSFRDVSIVVHHTSKKSGESFQLTLSVPELEIHDETPGSEEIRSHDTALNWNPPVLIKVMSFVNLKMLLSEKIPRVETEAEENPHEESSETEGSTHSSTLVFQAGQRDSLKIKIRQPSCTLNVPALDFDFFVRTCSLHISPRHFRLIADLVESILPDPGEGSPEQSLRTSAFPPTSHVHFQEGFCLKFDNAFESKANPLSFLRLPFALFPFS